MSGVERENEFKSKLRFSPVFKLFYDACCVVCRKKHSSSLQSSSYILTNATVSLHCDAHKMFLLLHFITVALW